MAGLEQILAEAGASGELRASFCRAVSIFSSFQMHQDYSRTSNFLEPFCIVKFVLGVVVAMWCSTKARLFSQHTSRDMAPRLDLRQQNLAARSDFAPRLSLSSSITSTTHILAIITMTRRDPLPSPFGQPSDFPSSRRDSDDDYSRTSNGGGRNRVNTSRHGGNRADHSSLKHRRSSSGSPSDSNAPGSYRRKEPMKVQPDYSVLVKHQGRMQLVPRNSRLLIEFWEGRPPALISHLSKDGTSLYDFFAVRPEKRSSTVNQWRRCIRCGLRFSADHPLIDWRESISDCYHCGQPTAKSGPHRHDLNF
ncbi:hypothetical protein K402DRAFT_394546 [Aulographum hederae CBS 113979]|uniref:Uncharacterized protein n=1 Tax=Aulographum hederae CBS 113979 TaxID=1176131 RepID=A0A6G1GX77_9PEZI|nr:hypothetical protein K402DRAFT_394546 [Aulographum hederae CBS 113979]